MYSAASAEMILKLCEDHDEGWNYAGDMLVTLNHGRVTIIKP